MCSDALKEYARQTEYTVLILKQFFWRKAEVVSNRQRKLFCSCRWPRESELNQFGQNDRVSVRYDNKTSIIVIVICN